MEENSKSAQNSECLVVNENYTTAKRPISDVMEDSTKITEGSSKSVVMSNSNKSTSLNSEFVAMDDRNKSTGENSKSAAADDSNKIAIGDDSKSTEEKSKYFAMDGSNKSTAVTSDAMDDNSKFTGGNSKSVAMDDSSESTGENSKSVTMDDNNKSTGVNFKSVAMDDSSKSTGENSKSFIIHVSNKSTGENFVSVDIDDSSKSARENSKSVALDDSKKSAVENSKSVTMDDSSKSVEEDSSHQPKEEIEGGWMCFLRKAVNLTIHKLAASGRYKVFASSFPALHEQYPQALKSLREQFLTKLETAVKEEAEKMYKDYDIVPLINQLEELSKQKKPGEIAWRPTGDVEEDLRAHTYPLRLKQRDRMRKIAEALTEENKQLRSAVDARRQKFLNTQRAVEDQAARVDQAYEACQELPVQKLIDFMKKESH